MPNKRQYSVVDPNKQDLVDNQLIEQAFDELRKLLETIELIIFTAHSFYRTLVPDKLIVNEDIFRQVYAMTIDYLSDKLDKRIVQIINEFSDINKFIEQVLDIYTENMKRYTEYLATPNYTPITIANQVAQEFKLVTGKDLAKIVYEYQMLYTSVQYAYMTIIEQINESAIPAFTYIRNRYQTYIGVLAHILPILVNVRKLIESNIRKTGLYDTTKDLLAKLYGVQLELLKGWLVRTTFDIHLFFVDFSENDKNNVYKAYIDYRQGIRTGLSKNALLIGIQETKALINEDTLWKISIDTLKPDVYRTGYVIADIRSIEDLGQQIVLYLRSLLFLYRMKELATENNININGLKQALLQFLSVLSNTNKQIYTQLSSLLLRTDITDTIDFDMLDSLYRYLSEQTTITIFGETYTLPIYLLIAISLVLLDNMFFAILADQVVIDDTSDVTTDDLTKRLLTGIITSLVSAEQIANKENQHIKDRNFYLRSVLIDAINTVRQDIRYLRTYIEAKTTELNINLTPIFDTYTNAHIDARIRELIKILVHTVLLVMPLIDPNLIVVPLVSSLYSFIAINSIPLYQIVSDLIIRTFELPYRLVMPKETQAVRQLSDYTSYLAFIDKWHLILTHIDLKSDTVPIFKRRCLLYCQTNNRTTTDDRIDAITDISSFVHAKPHSQYKSLNDGQITTTIESCPILYTYDGPICLQYYGSNKDAGFYCIPMYQDIAYIDKDLKILKYVFGKITYA